MLSWWKLKFAAFKAIAMATICCEKGPYSFDLYTYSCLINMLQQNKNTPGRRERGDN